MLSPAKTAELIKIPFGLWTRVGPRNHVLDGDPDPSCAKTTLCGKRYLQGKWLAERAAERARMTIILQRNSSFGEKNSGPSAFQLQETMLKSDKI